MLVHISFQNYGSSIMFEYLSKKKSKYIQEVWNENQILHLKPQLLFHRSLRNIWTFTDMDHMVYLNKFSNLTSLQFYFHQAALWTITVVLRCTPLHLSQWSKLTIKGAFFVGAMQCNEYFSRKQNAHDNGTWL